jgi:hypothetical protein
MNTKNSEHVKAGRLVKAPENFLAPQDIQQVFSAPPTARRDFLRRAFATAGIAAAAPVIAQSVTEASGVGDANILNLPEHSRSLGRPVATEGYGKPVMTARWGPSVAKNPFLQFNIRGAKAGDKVAISWTDSKGEKRTDEATVS